MNGLPFIFSVWSKLHLCGRSCAMIEPVSAMSHPYGYLLLSTTNITVGTVPSNLADNNQDTVTM